MQPSLTTIRQDKIRLGATAGDAVLRMIEQAENVLRGMGLEGLEKSEDWVPLIESVINDLVFSGIAMLFLVVRELSGASAARGQLNFRTSSLTSLTV